MDRRMEPKVLTLMREKTTLTMRKKMMKMTMMKKKCLMLRSSMILLMNRVQLWEKSSLSVNSWLIKMRLSFSLKPLVCFLRRIRDKELMINAINLQLEVKELEKT